MNKETAVAAIAVCTVAGAVTLDYLGQTGLATGLITMAVAVASRFSGNQAPGR